MYIYNTWQPAQVQAKCMMLYLSYIIRLYIPYRSIGTYSAGLVLCMAQEPKWDNTSMKLLHYQANNFHIKLAFNLSGLLLADHFLAACISTPNICTGLWTTGKCLGRFIHSGQTSRELNVWCMSVLWDFSLFPASDKLFCGLVPSITILVHFIVYLLPTCHPFLRTRDTATLVKNLSKMVGTPQGLLWPPGALNF